MFGYAAYIKSLVGDEKILSRDSIIKVFKVYDRVFNKIVALKEIINKIRQKFDTDIDAAVLHAYENFVKENSDLIFRMVKNTNQFSNKEEFMTWVISRFPMYKFFASVLEKEKVVRPSDLENMSDDQLYSLFKAVVEESKNVRSIYSLGQVDSTILDFLFVNFFSGNGYLLFYLENYLEKYQEDQRIEQQRKDAEAYVSKLLSKYYKDKAKEIPVEEKIIKEREDSVRKQLFREKVREIRQMIISPIKNLVTDVYEQIRRASPILRFFEWSTKFMFKLARITDERFNKGRLFRFFEKVRSGRIFSEIFRRRKDRKGMSKRDFEKLKNELSENIYQKKYSRLSDAEKEKIDKIASLIRDEKEKKAEIVEAILEAKNLNINKEISKDYDISIESKDLEKDRTAKKGRIDFRRETLSKSVFKSVEQKASNVEKAEEKTDRKSITELSTRPKGREIKKESVIKAIKDDDAVCRNIMTPTGISEVKEAPVLAQRFPEEREERVESIEDSIAQVYDQLSSEDRKYESEGDLDVRDITKRRRFSVKDYVKRTTQSIKDRIAKAREKLRTRFGRPRLFRGTLSKSVRKIPRVGLGTGAGRGLLGRLGGGGGGGGLLGRMFGGGGGAGGGGLLGRIFGGGGGGGGGLFGRLGGGLFGSGPSLPGAGGGGGGLLGRLGGGLLGRLGGGLFGRIGGFIGGAFGKIGGLLTNMGGGLFRAVGSIGRIGSILSRAGPIIGALASPAGLIIMGIVIALVLLAVGALVYFLFKMIKYMIDPIVEMAYGKGAKSALEAKMTAEQQKKVAEGLKQRLAAVRDVRVSESTKGYISEFAALSSGDIDEQNIYSRKEIPQQSTTPGQQQQQQQPKQSGQAQSQGQSQQTQSANQQNAQSPQARQAQQSTQSNQSQNQGTSTSPEAENTRRMTEQAVQAIQQMKDARVALINMTESVGTKGTMALNNSYQSNVNSEY